MIKPWTVKSLMNQIMKNSKLYVKPLIFLSLATFTHHLQQDAFVWQILKQMHTSNGILNLPTSSLHLCSPYQQNR